MGLRYIYARVVIDPIVFRLSSLVVKSFVASFYKQRLPQQQE